MEGVDHIRVLVKVQPCDSTPVVTLASPLTVQNGATVLSYWTVDKQANTIVETNERGVPLSSPPFSFGILCNQSHYA